MNLTRRFFVTGAMATMLSRPVFGKELLSDRFGQCTVSAIPTSNVLAMEGWHVWNNSIIEIADDKYVGFFDRWPSARGFRSWVTHGEICFATASSPMGPFRFERQIIIRRDNAYWDAAAAYNPHVIVHGGKFYLFYTGNQGNEVWPDSIPDKLVDVDDDWWVHRNSQRVGVAVADSIHGDWIRQDDPIIPLPEGYRTTGTPNIVQRGGEILLYFKAVKEKPGKVGGQVRHFVCSASDPLGPYGPAREISFVGQAKTRIPFDDHFEWWDGETFFAIVKDHDEKVMGGNRLLLFQSGDGQKWKLAKKPLLSRFQLMVEGRTNTKLKRFEMPKILFDRDGTARVLSLAAWDGEGEAFNVAIDLVNC
ncbi:MULTISPECIES: glycoside hydrolase family protein [unclassified Mesorhizobium]|uniref:glycoside hydrolase family protein n=1 Tax=unclassified Mesorhizobium TaxID=325217 RepID=UPI0030152809